MTLPEAWVSLVAPEQEKSASTLRRECERELAPNHPLAGRLSAAVARCSGCDDVVFGLSDGEGFALVHLTWRQAREDPPFPRTTFFASWEVRRALDAHPH